MLQAESELGSQHDDSAGGTAAWPRPVVPTEQLQTPSARFYVPLLRYVAALDAAFDLHRFADDALTRDFPATLLGGSRHRLEHLRPESREALKAGNLESALKEISNHVGETTEGPGAEVIIVGPQGPSTFGAWAFDLDDPRFKASLFEITDRDAAETMRDFVMETGIRAKRPAYTELLRRSMITLVVAAFEALFAQLLTSYYNTYPEAAGVDEKKFSLLDLQAFDSFSDAQAVLIESEVDGILRKDLDGWARWLDDRKISLDRLCLDWAGVREIYQRRHLIEHTDGVVSTQYIRQLDLEDPPSIGTRLAVDHDYVEAVFDEFNVMGVGLGIAFWVDFAKGDAAAGRFILERGEVLASRDRWTAVTALCGIAERVPRLPEDLTLALRSLKWLARKQTDGLAAVSSEIEQWDVSALAPRFALVKACLLSDLDEAIAQLPEALRAGDLSARHLYSTPVFRELTADSRFEQALEQASNPEDGSKQAPVGEEPSRHPPGRRP